jgi:hypothetical protein
MKHQRLILGSILLLLLFSLMLYYSLDHNNHDPDNQYILDHYEEFTITKVKLDGVVKNVDTVNHTLLIQVSSSHKDTLLVSTSESFTTTQPGDVVEVYGILTNRTHMNAETLLIYKQWAYDIIFLRSLPAIPFGVYLFFRTYRFNLDTRRFERRQKHA